MFLLTHAHAFLHVLHKLAHYHKFFRLTSKMLGNIRVAFGQVLENLRQIVSFCYVYVINKIVEMECLLLFTLLVFT